MNGSTQAPAVSRSWLAATGAGTMNGSAPANATSGRTPSRRPIAVTSQTAATTLRRTSGTRITATDGLAIQKNGAMIHDSTPRM